MAELVITDSQNYMDIADAIRSKNGSSDTYTPREMAAAIEAIPQGGVTPTGNIDITSAGVTDVTNYATATVPQAYYVSGVQHYYATESGQRKFVAQGYFSEVPGDGGFIHMDGFGLLNTDARKFNAIATGTSVTPTESAQTIGGNNVMLEGAVTVNAIPSNYVGSGITQRDSTDLSANGATVTAPSGYYSSAASKSVDTGSATAASSISATGATVSTGTNTLTLSKTVSNTPQVTAGYVASGTAGNSNVSLTATVNTRTSSNLAVSGATITAPSGYYAADASKSVASGSASAPSTISGTGATVTTGTNSLTLSKTVSVTPTVSAGYVTNGTATNSTVSLSASVTTKGATTYTPTTSNQTIASGTYLTGAQTISGDSNLVAGNIKKNVSIFGVTGSYEGGGSGTSVSISESYVDVTSATSSISFTSLLGEPTSFVVLAGDDVATGASPYKVAMVVYDGTSDMGQTITNTSNAQVSYNGSGFSHTYSNGTLTVTASTTQFQANTTYFLAYSYGGSAANIYTADVQVGSGATSITFTGLEDKPLYWSCIFKSNFSTSSGYQRVVGVYVDSQDDEYGLCMDSAAHFSASYWSSSYSNGSLTITSQGTNAGGYFHQPGYYQLTYAIGEASPYEKVNKTYYATTTAQTEKVSPSTGYDALAEVNVTVGALSQTNLTAANIKSGTTVTISNGNANVWSVLGTYSGGGGSVSYDTKTTTASNYPVSLNFTSMKGEPKAFVCRLNAQVSSSGNTTYYYIVDVAAFGTTTHGNCFRIGGTRRVENITSGYSWSYSGTTLTITSSAASRSASPGAFYSGSYELLYVY